MVGIPHPKTIQQILENEIKPAKLKKENAELRSVIDELHQQIEKYNRYLQEKIWVDLTPDEDLVRRILEAYIDESYDTDNLLGLPPESWVCLKMNENRDKRNRILRDFLSGKGCGK